MNEFVARTEKWNLGDTNHLFCIFYVKCICFSETVSRWQYLFWEKAEMILWFKEVKYIVSNIMTDRGNLVS